MIVVDLGATAASLYGIGYGRHERDPARVLPFYPAFLAGMNLVLVANDAYSFLVAWEFMSLASWALVMAHHASPATRARATSISSWRALARSRCCSRSACWRAGSGYAFGGGYARRCRQRRDAGLVLA